LIKAVYISKHQEGWKGGLWLPYALLVRNQAAKKFAPQEH